MKLIVLNSSHISDDHDNHDQNHDDHGHDTGNHDDHNSHDQDDTDYLLNPDIFGGSTTAADNCTECGDRLKGIVNLRANAVIMNNYVIQLAPLLWEVCLY